MRSTGCLLLLFVLCMAPVASSRNVVLFVTDDQGQDAGCYGNPVIKTPHLDALAADATRFQYAYATTASCSPSRSVILTGMFNHANGQYGLQHAGHHFQSFDNVKSLPRMLSIRRSITRQRAKSRRDGRQLPSLDRVLVRHSVLSVFLHFGSAP
jgi:N-sulfoglucosamine sulfohydrolase